MIRVDIVIVTTSDPVGMHRQDVRAHALLSCLVTDPELLTQWIGLPLLTLTADACCLHATSLHHATTLRSVLRVVLLVSLCGGRSRQLFTCFQGR